MKKSLLSTLILVLFSLFFSAKTFALDENFIRFSIDKSIYSQLTSTQQEALLIKAQDLISFIDRSLKRKIPVNIQRKLQGLKIKIYLTDTPGRDGLFTPDVSGEHTIAIQLIQLNSNGIKSLIAHEIYHAIHYHLNPDELPWVREGMAQLFEYITTGELNGRNLFAAIADPLTPLFGDYTPETNNPAQYGHNQLYFYYLYTHCGQDQLFWKITLGYDSLKGSFLIDQVLSQMENSANECQDFTESAISFEVAKAHNQMQFTKIKERDKYYVFAGDISPKFPKISSAQELKKVVNEMPVLSSLKLPLKDFLDMNFTCPQCEIFYAADSFPYDVSEKLPNDSAQKSAIIVKLRAK